VSDINVRWKVQITKSVWCYKYKAIVSTYILFQGIFIKPVVNALKVKKQDEEDPKLNEKIHESVCLILTILLKTWQTYVILAGWGGGLDRAWLKLHVGNRAWLKLGNRAMHSLYTSFYSVNLNNQGLKFWCLMPFSILFQKNNSINDQMLLQHFLSQNSIIFVPLEIGCKLMADTSSFQFGHFYTFQW
jgi:hypothetical protein